MIQMYILDEYFEQTEINLEQEKPTNRKEELEAIGRTVDRIIADPELSRQFLIRAGITDNDGNLTDQYRPESEKHMRLIPPPPLEINEGFEPGKTYDPNQRSSYSEMTEILEQSNRFQDQYLELAGLIFNEYKKVCDETDHDMTPEMMVIGQFLNDMEKKDVR